MRCTRSDIIDALARWRGVDSANTDGQLWPLATDTYELEELAAVVEVLLDGRMTMGPRTVAFEKAWTTHVGCASAVMVNSGSSANLLALAAMAAPHGRRPLQPGDEVIVPALTWPTAVHPIHQVGCLPVFADVEPDTLNISPATIRRALSPRTRAMVVVHTLGNPAPMDDIMVLAREHDLVVLEDTCESPGARVGDQVVGTFGDLSTFSFYFSHHISTIEGGMVCAGHDAARWSDLLRSLRSHGWVRERSDRAQLRARHAVQDDRWLFVTAGFNLRPTEINAALGLIQLQRMDEFIRQRQAVRRCVLAGLAPFEDVLQFQIERPHTTHSAFGFSIVVRPEAPFDRDALQSHLEAHGVQTRPLVGGNLARQPAFERIPHRVADDLVVANYASDHGLMIGINGGTTETQIDGLIRCIQAFMADRSRSATTNRCTPHVQEHSI